MGYPEAVYTINEVLKGVSNMGADQTGIPPLRPIVDLVPGQQKVTAHINLSDTIVENQKLCAVKGVMVRIKTGSQLTDKTDGTLVGMYDGKTHEITIPNLENGIWYCIGVWSYSDHNVYNLDQPFIQMTQPGADIVYGFHQDFTDSNPDTCISYIGANAQYTPMYTRTKDRYVHVYAHSNTTTMSDVYASTANTKPFTYGSWKNWPWLRKVKPFLVGIADAHTKGSISVKHRLDPNNMYLDADTKERVPILSEDKYPISRNGVFSWIPRIYVKETYDSDGNGRTVMFSETKSSSSTTDFVCRGFVNRNGTELKGVWLGTNYSSFDYFPKPFEEKPTSSLQNVITYAEPIASNPRYMNQNQTIPTYGDRNFRGFYFGGAFANLIRDILYMLYKTTDIQKASGYGCSGMPKAFGNNTFYTYYNYSDGVLLKPSGGKAKIIDVQDFHNIDTVWSLYGGFYGQDSVYTTGYNYNSSGGYPYICYGFGKLFFSLALGSYLASLIDPEFKYLNGTLYRASNHIYNPNTAAYLQTTYTTGNATSSNFPIKMRLVNNEVGSLPDPDSGGGSTSTGLADRLSVKVKSDITTSGYTMTTDADNERVCYIYCDTSIAVSNPGVDGPSTISKRFFYKTLKKSSDNSDYSLYDALVICGSDTSTTGCYNSSILMLLPDPNTTPYDDYDTDVWDVDPDPFAVA